MDDQPPLQLTISNLEPASAHVGDPDLVVHVIGTGFTPNSLITVDRVNLPTTLHSPTDLSTIIRPSEKTIPGMALITVKTGSEESNSLSFNLLPPLSDEQKAEKAKAATPKMDAEPKDPPPPPPPLSRKAAPPPPPHNPNMAQGQRPPTVPPKTSSSKK